MKEEDKIIKCVNGNCGYTMPYMGEYTRNNRAYYENGMRLCDICGAQTILRGK